MILLTSFSKPKEVSEATKNQMFCSASSNRFSTDHIFVVIKVKNLQTGEIKEVCTCWSNIAFALYEESFDILRLNDNIIWGKIDCSKYKNRYFEFFQNNALKTIGFNDYSKADLDLYSSGINVKSVLKILEGTEKEYPINFKNNKDEYYFAHIMFNYGVVVTSGCWGCRMYYFRNKKLLDP